VTSTFPLARSGKPGYDVAEVDAFLERARTAYSLPPGHPEGLSSLEIRRIAFRVVRKNGYSARHVDAALERLDEAFAAREREQEVALQGSELYYQGVRATAQEIINRLARGDGNRFRRVGVFTRGYHPADVDAFSRLISAYFEQGRALPVETVRTIAFRSKYRGYHEAQVDLLLDAVVELMLAVR
jgi:DivIVA domain-containing protein